MKVSPNTSIYAIIRKLTKQNIIEFQLVSVIHFVLFIASMTFTIYYNVYTF